MAWHIFEKLLEGVANYSPFIGKIWITFLFMLRLIMVASIGDTVYGDEQSNFVCNTLEPGCENICYNKFAPISQIRFWAVQIVFVGTPSIMFVVYAMHRMTTIPPSDASKTQSQKPSSDNDDSYTAMAVTDNGKKGSKQRRKKLRSKLRETPTTGSMGTRLPGYDEVIRSQIIDIETDPKKTNVDAYQEMSTRSSRDDGSRKYENIYSESSATDKMVKLKSLVAKDNQEQKTKEKRKAIYSQNGMTEIINTPGIARAYVAQALLRTAIEAAFLYFQYSLYKFEVKELFICTGNPCPHTVDCFVSRPMEKTYFLLFMYFMTILSLVLNAIEIGQLSYKFLKRRFCGNSKSDTKLPMEQVVIESHGNGHYRRARMQNTFPDLGPFPRQHDNSFGESSDNNSIDSDYRYYA